MSVLDRVGYIKCLGRRMFPIYPKRNWKMTTYDYTFSNHGIVPPTGRINLPINVAGHIPNYKRLNDEPLIKTCEIPLGIRDASLQVSKTLSFFKNSRLNKLNVAQDPSLRHSPYQSSSSIGCPLFTC